MTMLIDVRTPEEYAAGHVEGALNIPVEEIVVGNLGAIAGMRKDTPLRLYCRSGARSGHASMLLESAGFTQVTNIGGLEAAMQLSNKA